MAIMASSSSFPALSLLIVLLLASSASARPGLPFHPCKTLLISTFSVSFQPRNSDEQSRPEIVAVVAEFRGFRPGFVSNSPQFRPQHPRGLIRAGEDETLTRPQDLALGSSNSFRDRSLDVLNVLASLLFGAACGALTAGTMYIAWLLLTRRFEAYQSLDDFSDDDDDDEDDEIFYPKKARKDSDEVRVAVPAVPSATDSAETALLRMESA